MKKIVGDPARFAGIYELNSSYCGAWLFGKFCFRIGGIEVGDFELGTTLRDVLLGLEMGARDWGRRHSPRFFRMCTQEAFRELHTVLGSFIDESVHKLAWDEEWIRFKFLPEDNVFDEWEAYVIDDEEVGRVIFSKEPFVEIHEVLLRAGECDAVLREIAAQIGQLYDAEARNK